MELLCGKAAKKGIFGPVTWLRGDPTAARRGGMGEGGSQTLLGSAGVRQSLGHSPEPWDGFWEFSLGGLQKWSLKG